jgi:hypothetical protein
VVRPKAVWPREQRGGAKRGARPWVPASRRRGGETVVAVGQRPSSGSELQPRACMAPAQGWRARSHEAREERGSEGVGGGARARRPATVARAGKREIEPHRCRTRDTEPRSEKRRKWRSRWRDESGGGAAIERERRCSSRAERRRREEAGAAAAAARAKPRRAK